MSNWHNWMVKPSATRWVSRRCAQALPDKQRRARWRAAILRIQRTQNENKTRPARLPRQQQALRRHSTQARRDPARPPVVRRPVLGALAARSVSSGRSVALLRRAANSATSAVPEKVRGATDKPRHEHRHHHHHHRAAPLGSPASASVQICSGGSDHPPR